MKLHRLLILLALPLILIPTACNEEESSLGVNLQDPYTLYNGIRDTIMGGDMYACTIFDDSLLTMNQNFGIIGHYSDATYGSVEAILFSQIALTSNSGVRFDDQMHIDSVVLTLIASEWYPASSDSSNTYSLHFDVRQLAQPFKDSTLYYSFDNLPVNDAADHCFFNSTVNCTEKDSIIRLKLNTQNIRNLLITAETEEEFQAQSKGLRIRIAEGSDPALVSLNLASANSNLTAYYTYGEDTTQHQVSFVVGNTATVSAKHFTQFIHSHSATTRRIANHTADSIKGDQYLYLSPLGGTNIRLNLNPWIENFHRQHPTAIIHYAELIVPVADIADDNPPKQLLAYKNIFDGQRDSIIRIPDLQYDATLFDGYYNKEKRHYRIRVTQHLQKLLRTGTDYGTLLLIDGRLSTARRTIANGKDFVQTHGNPIRIDFIYSE